MVGKIILSLVVAALIQGCAAPYSKFYYDQTGGADITTDPKIIISKNEPKLFRGADQEKILKG